ncbi:hypothetical protein GA0116948_103102 [Chitinophaga costaii]|uniref:Uncharacterized protein n=1 Tax=Chitinophaga costaii TaxID=1335309 RepID=A0A1C4BI51_9BACT|nr:hypothetical protein GA0116948_103102 [Chitinophaga costaii]
MAATPPAVPYRIIHPVPVHLHKACYGNYAHTHPGIWHIAVHVGQLFLTMARCQYQGHARRPFRSVPTPGSRYGHPGKKARIGRKLLAPAHSQGEYCNRLRSQGPVHPLVRLPVAAGPVQCYSLVYRQHCAQGLQGLCHYGMVTPANGCAMRLNAWPNQIIAGVPANCAHQALLARRGCLQAMVIRSIDEYTK